MKFSVGAVIMLVGSTFGFTNYQDTTRNDKQCHKTYFHNEKITHQQLFMAVEDADADTNTAAKDADTTTTVDQFGRATVQTTEKKGMFAKMVAKLPFQKTTEEELEIGQQELFQEEQKLKEDIIRQKLGNDGPETLEEEKLLQEEKEFRIEMELMISDLSKEYEEKQQELTQKIQALNSTETQLKDDIKIKTLTRNYKEEQQKLDKAIRTLTTAKEKLEGEIQQRKDIQQTLKEVIEDNRNLEDAYELGQNDNVALEKELIETKEQLQTISRQLNITQGDLKLVIREMKITDRSLLTTATSLVKLQKEQNSLRKLGKRMLTLSMNRIKKRILGKKEEEEANKK